MATQVITSWPNNSDFSKDGKIINWNWNNWETGTPITQVKLENLEEGIAILATQMQAILGEIGTATYPDLISNSSRLDNIQEWITGSDSDSYIGDNIASRLNTQDDDINEIRGWIAGGSGYQNDNSIDGRLNTVENSIENIDSSIENINSSIELITWVTGSSGYSEDTSIASRVDTLEDNIETLDDYLTNRIENLENSDNDIRIWITGDTGSYYEGTDLNSRLYDLETLVTGNDSLTTRIENLESDENKIKTWITSGNDYSGIYLDERLNELETLTTNDSSRISTVESIVGNGVIGSDTDISAAIRRLLDIVAALDPTGSAEAISFLVSEVWGQSSSQDTDFTADSRIDTLENVTSNLGNQITTLATEQNTLEQNLVATNAKIPIEMYIATNSSASDTIVLNAAPQDKSIFFIAVPQGTLGVNNLVLQTNDIQFNNVIVKKTYNGEGIKIKYAPNSLISIYRNGSNAYVYNVPMVL